MKQLHEAKELRRAAEAASQRHSRSRARSQRCEERLHRCTAQFESDTASSKQATADLQKNIADLNDSLKCKARKGILKCLRNGKGNICGWIKMRMHKYPD